MKKIKVNGKLLNLDNAVELAKTANNDKAFYCKQLRENAQNLMSKIEDTEPTNLDRLHEQKLSFLTNMYFKLVNANKKKNPSLSIKDIEKEVRHSLSAENFDEFSANLESMLKDAKRVSEYSAKVTYKSIIDVTNGVIDLLENENKYLDSVVNENIEENNL